MLALLGEMTAAEVGLKPRASTGPRGEAATTSGRVANLIVGNGHRRPGNCLNLSNRPVRTRMPGGVAGDAEASPPRPYADLTASACVGFASIAISIPEFDHVA